MTNPPLIKVTSVSKPQIARIIAWSLLSLVSVLSFAAWASSYHWQLWPLTSYQFFPLLGLLAFGVMWTHYMLGALIRFWHLKRQYLASYFRWTGYAVLVLICLHPGILMYQRFKDGYGLPPHSYESYVSPSLGWITLLGTASLFIFLAFELHRFFGKRSWWHFVADASDVAMLAIVYHALRLGSTLQQGWFLAVWWLYAVTLIAALIYKYSKRVKYRSLHQEP